MTTVTKTFAFLSNSESFSGVSGGSGVTMDWYASDGNPAGCLRSALTSNSLTRVNYWEWVGTWEDLGVPSGATVTYARLNSGNWKCSNYSRAGSGNTAGPYKIYSNDATPVQIAQIWAGASVSGTTSWQTISAQSDQAIGSSYQASSTTVRIRLYDTHVTSVGAGPNVTLLDDQVSLVITYTSGGSSYDDSISLARSGGLSQANVMTFEAALTLSKVGGVGPGSVMTLGEALTLSKVAGLSSAGGMDVFDALTLARALGLSTLSGMSVSEVISLGRAMGLSEQAGMGFAAALTLARAAGASAAGRLDAGGQVGLSKSLGVSGGVQGVYGVVLDLARAMGAALAAGLEADEAIGLGLALALVGEAGAAPVTPGSRIYAVQGESRILIVPAEGRVYVIDAEGRVTVIEV